jgi:endonuclease/exonuclease/phosphatase family metal-dependent hydrolase
VTLAAETSTKEILATLAAQRGKGFALFGDLNQIASDQGPQACLSAGLVDLGAEFDAAPTEADRRIDYAFVDAALAACVEAMHVEPGSESDHNALLVDLSIACLEATLD